MSSLLGAAKQRTQKDPEPVENIQQIKVDATEAARRRKRSLSGQGRRSTQLAGLQNVLQQGLKRRLGE
jgi:hypothetical protein